MSEGRLAENIVHFARLLRRAGLPVGPAAVVDGIRAAALAGLGTRDDLRSALRCVFVTRHDQEALFEQAFRFFWRNPHALATRLHEEADTAALREGSEAPAARRLAEALASGEDLAASRRMVVEIDARRSVSAAEAFNRRDFAQMTVSEIDAAARAVAGLVMPDDRVRTRRRVGAPPPGRVDPRRTLRASLRTGGDMILLRRARPRLAHPPIVVLCDISGSMAAYSRVLLHFVHALGEHRAVHTFLFGTRLSNVSRELRRRDVDEALAACSAAVPDWSGGTRIAAAMEDFNRRWSRRVLGQGAIVLLVTDGLERGDLAALARETDRLHRSCRRLICLNPLLGFDGFAPRAGGIRAMLPHVDEFRPIHSLEAVADLCLALAAGPPKSPRPSAPPGGRPLA